LSKKKPTYAELQARLAQAEATLEALRRGEIDILVGEAGPLRIRLKSLVEENERLAREWQTTFDTVQDAIWVLDADQRILRANQAAEEVFGCPLAEMPGRRCFDIAHHTDEPIPGCPFCLMRVSRQRESFEMQLGERWLEVTADPLLDENGILIGAVHIASDITERKQAEQDMAESLERERFLGNLIRTASVAIGVGYPDGSLGMCNPAFQKLTGYSEEELKTIAWNTVLTPPEWLESEMQSLAELHRTKQPVVYEKEYIHKSGKRVPIELVVHPFFDAGGEVSHYYAFITDITERAQAEEQLRAAHAELQRLLAETEQSRRTLLSVVEDQRAAEEALHESEERYRTVADYTYDWEYWRAPDGKILYMSPSCERITGYRAEEFVENPDLLEAIVAPEDRQTLELHQVSAKSRDQRDSVHQVDFRILRRDGQLRWIAHTCQIIRRPDGANLGQRASNRDITERQQAEETIRSLARFPSENPNPVMRIAREGTLLYANEAALTLLAEWELKAGEAAPAALQGLASAVFSAQRAQTVEIPCGERLFSIAAAPTPDDAYVNLYARDVTERQQAEAALRALAARQEALLAAIPDIIMEVDANKVYTWANRAGREFFGEDVIGKEAAFYFDGEQDIYAVVQPLFNGDENTLYVESWQRCRDGQKRLLAWWCRVLKDEHGNVTGALSSARDITEQKRAEDEIRRLNTELETRVRERTVQLEAANKELEAFAYSISHDLRAPLRAIDGFAQILLEDYAGVLDAEGMRLFNVVRSNTKKMDQLITDILALSRVTRTELKLAAVDMTTLAHSMFHEVALAEVQQKFTLVVQPLPAAHGDPTLLRQVWANLLSNAVKYTLPQEIRNIQVGGYTQADMNVYYVQDSGVGFNPAYSDKLFGVFQRLHGAEEFEGTGVGLAIVQRIVHRHGGRVWAEGQVGRGATFYFSLPKKEVGDAPHE
jgi:PAS domain S-box-containing protein